MEEDIDNPDYKAWEAKFRCANLKSTKKHSVGKETAELQEWRKFIAVFSFVVLNNMKNIKNTDMCRDDVSPVLTIWHVFQRI